MNQDGFLVDQDKLKASNIPLPEEFLVDQDKLKASSNFLTETLRDNNLHVSPSSRLNILLTSVLDTIPLITKTLCDIAHILRNDYKTLWAFEHSQKMILSANEMDKTMCTCQYISDCISDFDCGVTKDIQTGPSLSTASMEAQINQLNDSPSSPTRINKNVTITIPMRQSPQEYKDDTISVWVGSLRHGTSSSPYRITLVKDSLNTPNPIWEGEIYWMGQAYKIIFDSPQRYSILGSTGCYLFKVNESNQQPIVTLSYEVTS